MSRASATIGTVSSIKVRTPKPKVFRSRVERRCSCQTVSVLRASGLFRPSDFGIRIRHFRPVMTRLFGTVEQS